MKPYRAIIIDDELPARLRLNKLSADFPDIIEVVGEAENGNIAVELIDKVQPDLIFLDIQMPGKNGFEVLRQIRHNPFVVFCTAYDEFALRAFDSLCVDYLLKPVTRDRFEDCVHKLKKFSGHHNDFNLQQLSGKLNFLHKREDVTSIPVKAGDRVIFVKVEDVSYFMADEKYVTLVTKHAKSHLLDCSLKKMEEKLGHQFIRIHKTYLVNRKLIREVHKHFNNRYVLVMDDYEQSRLTSGRSYFSDIKGLLEL